MGYTKIVQFGNVTEIYEYEKNRPDYKERHVSSLTKKRNKKAREHAKIKGTYKRRKQHVIRTTNNFFRLCHHNNCLASTIHFFTLTFAYDVPYKTACRHVARYMERIKKDSPKIPVLYISVPELTKKGRFHFHLLVYNLPTEKTESERKTRYFQRLFERGYVDIRHASYTSKGIAGYMAKYMAKAFTDERIEGTRVYNTSRGIEKVRSHGSNALSTEIQLFTPIEGVEQTEKREYDVPYLGKCLVTKITSKIKNEK